jgi:hypothetical protein
LRFEVYCDESQQALFGRFGENQPPKRLFLGGAWTKAHARSDLKASIRQRSSSRLRRAAAVLAALLFFSFLCALGQQQPCDALAAAIGDTIQVSGLVDTRVTGDSTGHWAWFYISESGCRIRVYYNRGDLPWLAEGSRLLITGRRTEFNDEPQIEAQSVQPMEAKTALVNPLTLIFLILPGVTFGAIAVVVTRRRQAGTRSDNTPGPRPDAGTAPVEPLSSETLASQDKPEVRETGWYSGDGSGQVLHKRKHSHDEDSTTGARPIGRGYPRAYKHSHELQSNEIAFLPLAVSSMNGGAVCVAGLNIETQSWVRLVRQGMYSLNEAEAAAFRDRSLMVVQIGGHQARPLQLDPRGLHTEDTVIKGQPRKLTPLDPADKLALLESWVDADLENALSTKRSLFVVEPTALHLIARDGKQPKIAFETPTTSTDALRSSRSLQSNLIGISSLGCPCNCLSWDQAPGRLGRSRTHNDILRLYPGARIFLALSLTSWPEKLPPDKRKHYLLVAGIHVIGRDQVWL